MSQGHTEVRVKLSAWQILLPLTSLSAFFLGWEAIVRFGIVPEALLASPSQVFSVFIDMRH